MMGSLSLWYEFSRYFDELVQIPIKIKYTHSLSDPNHSHIFSES